MKQRWVMLLWAGLLLGLLAACQNTEDSSTPAATTASGPTNTAVPTEIRATATPIVVATLPPVVDLRAASATPRATRTPAPSITPAPSRTTDLMIPITPDTATPEGATEEPATPEVEIEGFEGLDAGPTIRLTYGDIMGRLREYERPFTEDVILTESYLLEYVNGLPQLTFDVRIEGASEATNITAEILFLYDLDQARVFVQLGIVYLTEDPGQIYEGETIQQVKGLIQQAFDELLVESYNRQMGQNRGFFVTEARVSEDGVAVFTTRGG
jgi:hypothetical protein